MTRPLKLLSQTIWALFVVALLASPSKADSTYTYTGNTFTAVGGTLSCPPGCSINGSFTVAGPLSPDSAYYFTPESFSFSAMGVTFTQATASRADFGVITNSLSQIIGWNMDWYQGSYEMFSGTGPSVICPSGCSQIDVIAQVSGSSVIGGGNVMNDPGTWSMTTTSVPEPSSLLLLTMGMLVVVCLSFKKVIA